MYGRGLDPWRHKYGYNNVFNKSIKKGEWVSIICLAIWSLLAHMPRKGFCQKEWLSIWQRPNNIFLKKFNFLYHIKK
jgi:hypothetical protein